MLQVVSCSEHCIIQLRYRICWRTRHSWKRTCLWTLGSWEGLGGLQTVWVKTRQFGQLLHAIWIISRICWKKKYVGWGGIRENNMKYPSTSLIKASSRWILQTPKRHLQISVSCLAPAFQHLLLQSSYYIASMSQCLHLLAPEERAHPHFYL